MMRIRRAEERGHTRIGWLDSRHSFSFGGYYDPEHMGFRALRVLNDDRVAPGAGFGTHGHRDMEILSYVLEGALEHKDSSGGGGVIRPGEIQFMRAGTGVTHSEYNHSQAQPVHFLQIWIQPSEAGLPPGYDQRSFDTRQAESSFALLASRDGRDDSIRLHQDAELEVARIASGETRQRRLDSGRHAWVHVARGNVTLGGEGLREGDAAAVTGESSLEIEADRAAEVLIFDLA
jgi:redox-sensitive bicupin YhaK (pirin superfamily)